METTQALTPQDLELLGHGRSSRSLQMALNAMMLVIFLCFGGLGSWALYDGVQFDRDVPIFASLAAIGFLLALAACFWMWRRWRRQIRPLRMAVAANRKRVVAGMLTLVERLPRGRLRYTVNGEAFEVDLLLGLDTRATYLFGRPLESFRHLSDVTVELHTIALGPDVTLLLQADYPQTPPIARTERPTGTADVDRVVKEAKSNALTTVGVGSFVLLLVLGIGRWATGSWGLTVAMVVLSAIGLAIILPLVVLPRVWHARRSTGLVAIEGLVTEVMSSRVRYGRGSSFTVLWYRVGGALLCPGGFGVEGGPAEPGDRVKFEFMTRKGLRGDGRLMHFQTVAPHVVAKVGDLGNN
jgi:hypothetical protein